MTDAQKAQIERINQVSAMARTSWITLLAYLAYVGITLLAVEDADFFVPSRQTQLPLVGISIPTASFFIFAPILAAALYVYLHIILLKLWDAIADISPKHIDGQPLGDHLNPWLVNDWALSLKGGAAAPARPLRTIGKWASLLLVWVATPVVLYFFWLWSMPAHDVLLTLLLGACFLVALHAGDTSLRTANAWLAQPRRELADTHRRHRDIWYLGTFLACVTLLGTVLPLEIGGLSTLKAANLAQAEIIDLPESWRTPEVARHAYRETWCKREGLGMEICDHLPDTDHPVPAYTVLDREKWCLGHEIAAGDTCASRFADLDARFKNDWRVERASSIANLPKLDLENEDLRSAVAPNVSLVGANLTGARLEGADLREARLEGANLTGARLQGASLLYARLEGAKLRDARLEGADLREARLEGAWLIGADLSEARLEGAVLWQAWLEWANLRGADFKRSEWAGAWSRGSPAHFADFRAGQDLTQALLEDLIGNADTLLPDTPAPDTGLTFYIPSCWATPPVGFDALVARVAQTSSDDAETIRAGFLCPEGEAPQETGTPCPVDLPQDQCPIWWFDKRHVERD